MWVKRMGTRGVFKDVYNPSHPLPQRGWGKERDGNWDGARGSQTMAALFPFPPQLDPLVSESFKDPNLNS
jgi:hypothetical protein